VIKDNHIPGYRTPVNQFPRLAVQSMSYFEIQPDRTGAGKNDLIALAYSYFTQFIEGVDKIWHVINSSAMILKSSEVLMIHNLSAKGYAMLAFPDAS